jgi:hypothetical protein
LLKNKPLSVTGELEPPDKKPNSATSFNAAKPASKGDSAGVIEVFCGFDVY